MTYVALLRGINVGGNRKVLMAELRQVFAGIGFTDVVTYINSGNVMFRSDIAPDVTLIQKTMEEYFGFATDTLVLSADQLRAIASAIPSEWENNHTDQKSDVCFLFPDVDSPGMLEDLGVRPEFETVVYVPGAILSNVSRENQSKSSLLKIVGTPLYRRMTVRNVTTVRKLAEFLQYS